VSLDLARDRRNRDVMRAYDLDALVCRLPENVLLLTGYWPLSSIAFVLYPREGPVTLIAVVTEEEAIPSGAVDKVRTFAYGVVAATDPYGAVRRHLAEAVHAGGLGRGRIGYEGSFEAIAPGHMAAEPLVPAGITRATIADAAPDAVLVDATTALYDARACKTPTEIDYLRRANQVAALGLAAFRATFEPGRTEADVVAAVEAAIRGQGAAVAGARHVRAWAELMSGPASARAYSAHPATSRRVIERGDLGLLELATVVDGYWSDLTRTLVAGGAPTTRQRELYAAILAAHHAVMGAAQPGMTGAQVDALARGVLDDQGLGGHFVHHTGHGLGFRYHEPQPFLHPANEWEVREGMVTSIEPGLYIEGFGGLRLEENVVFTSGGVERLSDFDTDLAGARDAPETTNAFADVGSTVSATSGPRAGKETT